jgi:hypothetical protein
MKRKHFKLINNTDFQYNTAAAYNNQTYQCTHYSSFHHFPMAAEICTNPFQFVLFL